MHHPALARSIAAAALASVLLLVLPAAPHSRAQAAPGIKLVSPTAGQTVSGPLDVRAQVTNFTLDGTKIGTPPQAGIGHWHVYVDNKYAGLSVSDVVTIPNDALPDIAAGQHEIKVQLHNNDHTPVAGDIISTAMVNFAQEVKFTPSSGSPAIKITAPANGAALSTTQPNVIHVQVTGLTLDGTKIGTPPQQGVGHWHLYIDGKYAGLSVSNSISVPNDAMPQIAPGQHEVKVQLHNNDHTPIAGDIINTITANFAAAPAGAASAAAPTNGLPGAGNGGYLNADHRHWPELALLGMAALLLLGGGLWFGRRARSAGH